MYDYGEYVDPYFTFNNSKKGDEMHNEYANIYHKAAYDYLIEKYQEKKDYAPEFVYYVRSGYTNTVGDTWAVWTGDPSCDFTKYSGLPSSLSAMISAGLTGISFTVNWR